MGLFFKNDIAASPKKKSPPKMKKTKENNVKTDKSSELYLMSCFISSGLFIGGAKIESLILFSFIIIVFSTTILFGTALFFFKEENEEATFLQFFTLIIVAIICFAFSYAIFDKLGGKL